MATTKTIEQFPGVYSGQGRSWEKRIKTRINLLRPVDGIRPKVALEPRAPNTITATAAVVSEEERIAYGARFDRSALRRCRGRVLQHHTRA